MKYLYIQLIIISLFTTSTANAWNEQRILSSSIILINFTQKNIHIDIFVKNKYPHDIKLSKTDLLVAISGMTARSKYGLIGFTPISRDTIPVLPPPNERFNILLKAMEEMTLQVECHGFFKIEVSEKCPFTRDGDYIWNASCPVRTVDGKQYTWKIVGAGNAKISYE